MKPKLVRITTVPVSLDKLLEGQLRFMGQWYDVTAISSDEPDLKRIAARENAEWFCVGMTRQITPVKDLKAVIRLYRFLKKHQPLIVHSHTPKAGIIAMLAAKLAGVPHRLHTVAGLPLLEATGVKRRILERVEKLTYGCATGVYPNSFGLKNIIVSHGYCPEEKLKVLAGGSSNGIDTGHFSMESVSKNDVDKLRSDLKISQSDFVFIFVGRLVADKGINELVQAFKKLALSRPDVKLLLVGAMEQDLDPLSVETATDIETHPQIIPVGYQKDVRPYFALSDALVFPSYREGFPNVVMQACAMGLPAIVSDINGCNEIVENGLNGIVIAVKDAGAIFSAMQKLLDDGAFYQLLSSHARKSITARYEQALVWEAILNEYRTFAPNPD